MQTETSTEVNEKSLSLTAKLRKFSDESAHKPGMATVTSTMFLQKSIFKSIVSACYANGNIEVNKGYVSLAFRWQVPLIVTNEHSFNSYCEVAVEDVAGNKKFVRSFTFPYDAAPESTGHNELTEYCIDRYIERKTLLEDRDNLLPDDLLTLKVDIYLQTLSSTENSTDIESAIDNSFKILEDTEGPIIELSLNSELAERLYEVSSVFRAMCNNPMKENTTGIALLPDDKKTFRNAGQIIMGKKEITFDYFEEIIGLYIFADKYDIQSVIRACRKFCESFLQVKNSWGSFELVVRRAHKILELANHFSDYILKEIVDKFFRDLKNGVIEDRYICEKRNLSLGSSILYGYHSLSSSLYFELEEENDGDRSEFEFYS